MESATDRAFIHDRLEAGPAAGRGWRACEARAADRRRMANRGGRGTARKEAML